MFVYDCQIRVRYGETDQMGYLYYGNYALYFEVARAEAMRSFGITYKYMEEEIGVMLPVMTMNTRYLRPAKYDELLTVRTIIKEQPTDFMRFHYEVYGENKKLGVSSEVKLAFINRKTMRRCVCPDYLLDHLKPYFIKKEEGGLLVEP